MLPMRSAIGAPVVTCPPVRSSEKTPDRISTASGSRRCVVKRDRPGRRRSSSGGGGGAPAREGAGGARLECRGRGGGQGGGSHLRRGRGPPGGSRGGP